MTVNEAIVSSSFAGTRDTLKYATISLRAGIKKAFSESIKINLHLMNLIKHLMNLPHQNDHRRFLNMLFLGQDPKLKKCKKTRCLIKFSGQDIYGIRLSHIFKIPSISNEKPSISIEIPSISIENFGFRSKY